MVARKFVIDHNDSTFDIEYDTDDGFEVFKYQLFSLTSIPPDEQKILGGDGDGVVLDDSDLAKISDKLRLVSVGDESTEQEGLTSGGVTEESAESVMKSDEELARMLQAEEEALMLQQFISDEGTEQVENRLQPYIDQVLKYEDSMRQEAARKTVPVEELEEKALVSLAKEGIFNPSKSEQDHAFLLQLLFWFKQSFRWVNAPPCDSCGSETVNQGKGAPLPEEQRYGGSRVEIYRCKLCSRITRFPRYNDPLKLVETRKGRCGEWANCFTLYCRAFGYESRLILDFTDHVWTECFSHTLGRWMHLDPCEGVYDKPLLYEKGWGKKLNYIFAIAKDGVIDVTKRYTRKWHEVLARRNFTTENALTTVLTNLTNESRRGFAAHLLSVIENRDKREREELERCLRSPDEDAILLPGRQSGDKEWRISRSELGSDNSSSIISSSCPSRVCVDEHVTRINDAFRPILSHFVVNSVSKSSALEVLKFFKGALVDLQRFPYKTRRTSIKFSFSDTRCSLTKLLPAFHELLGALFLRTEVEADGAVDIYLADEPVKTSLALPVAMDALNFMIQNLQLCPNFNMDSLSLPLLKLNRICSGTVFASGEELPFGIATSAFDGLYMSKWEEPNGAKGSWIIYKLKANQMHELVAYELMSANDAPERDPMDWVLEGSDDEGSSWRVLDEQTSQLFDDRFQHKAYTIKSEPFLANIFRFRFLSVRDVDSTSRLQIGNIDLYARNTTLPTI